MRAEEKALRVLMLITNLGQGGAERVFHDHATAFAESRLAVEQAVFAGDYDDAYRTPLPLHQLKTPAWLKLLGPVGRLVGRAYALNELVGSGQFDVVVSHMDGANWVNALSRSKAAKVLVVHGSVIHDRNQPGWRQWLRTRWLIPVLYNQCQTTVAVSEGIGLELTQLGVKRVESIPNFFDIATIQNKAGAALPDDLAALFDSGKVMVTTGRLSPQKNQLQLLKLFAEIRAHRSGIRLAVLGDGERREELLSASEALGLRVWHVWSGIPAGDAAEADVWFLGYQKNPFAFLARSQLFLFPSLWEGFPLALCEAMVCGIPVLSADCPTGPREILASDNDPIPLQATQAEMTGSGVLLPMLEDAASREIWADAVLHLLNSPAECTRLAEGGKAAVARLDRAVILARWQAVLQRVKGLPS